MADLTLYLGNGDERILETVDASDPVWEFEVIQKLPPSLEGCQDVLVRITKPLTTFKGGFAQSTLRLSPRDHNHSIAPFVGHRWPDGIVEVVWVEVGLLRDEGQMAVDGNIVDWTIAEVVRGKDAASRYWTL